MKSYRVEEMADEMVVSYYLANASAPWQAAEKATGKEVQGRKTERFWVRVTDERDGAVSKYAFKIRRPEPPLNTRDRNMASTERQLYQIVK
ncbi:MULTISPECIES: hypothetical protein [unclassified Mesorhizobium]|uniref:hypothetical protein n=1 Tax=unclassified Mesorhizobium TaxID=325217 RepID=UPI000FCA43BC|nr:MULTISPECIES: hypothetical protein [unclassified Mesorhizobium]RUV10538.1 hypothetical protein EOA91_31330 [Mesorhizobium sp. M1A.F.Ca.IN.022.04.1.1]RWG24564.1 MAG: hypothetical protein EOQ60_32170 [Mesorhizobium sp.]TIS18152.1 MAG: hypothetical protein E5X10_00600 [Mesorhizobium sp.]